LPRRQSRRPSQADSFQKHPKILWALLIRELSTRYGRDNIGFLWIMVEHLIFACGVSVLWVLIRPATEHGIHVLPFVLTGYLPMILLRQTLSFCVSGVRVNNDLLYHRQITPLHIFLTRCGVEIIGTSLTFVFVISIIMLFGGMRPPEQFVDLGYVYGGWLILAWMAVGIAIIIAAIAQIIEFAEKFVQVFTYVLVPVSGCFYMVSWLPAWARPYALSLPFVHCFEMIRRGFFGEHVKTYFDPLYAIAWCAIFTMIGLTLTLFVRDRVEVF
jgi:capsular polysaccharide transport system permease protein